MAIDKNLDADWLPFSAAFRNGDAAAHAAGPDRCAITGAWLAPEHLVPVASLRPIIRSRILDRYPHVGATDAIDCREAVRLHEEYMAQLMTEEARSIAMIEDEIASSHALHDAMIARVGHEPQERRSSGEIWADRLAAYGSSWGFMLGFIALLLIWIVVNLEMGSTNAFDPYPFILLNLLLSCLAALQAPVIMMSQRRQEAKDRLRAQSDYEVNLRAELEIRNLQKKMDHLLRSQWIRLNEMQGLQLEMLRLRR